MPSLLARLASHFTQKEYLATQGLGYILDESAAARDAIAALLKSATGLDVRVTAVATQVTSAGALKDEASGSRPDLALYDRPDTLLALVEGKFWAGLTDAQPVEYLRALRDKRGRILLFIVPEKRLTTLPPLLGERIRAAGLGKLVWRPRGDSRVAAIKRGPAVVVTSWRSVLQALNQACLSTDQAVLGDLLQLEGLVGQFEAEGFQPLSEEELSDLSTPRRLANLVRLYEKAVMRAVQERLLSIKSLNPTHSRLASGRYASFAVAGAWMGMDLELWAMFHASPLWVWFPRDEWGRAAAVDGALEAWERHEPQRLFRHSKGTAVPLRVLAGVEEKAAVEGIVAQLGEIRSGLQAAGLSNRLGRLRLGRTNDRFLL